MRRIGITEAYVPLLSLVPSLDEAPALIHRLARLFESHRATAASVWRSLLGSPGLPARAGH